MAISKRCLIIGIVVGVTIVLIVVSIVVVYLLEYGGSGSETTKAPNRSFKRAPPEFEKECLEAHNYYRVYHTVPKIELSSNISIYAQEWAEELIRMDAKEQPHIQYKYGENIFSVIGDTNVPCSKAVYTWHRENKSYSILKPEYSTKNGHFTQLVWRASTKLGCGYAEQDKKVFIVCNYFPPGNIKGGFQANVGIPDDYELVLHKRKPEIVD